MSNSILSAAITRATDAVKAYKSAQGIDQLLCDVDDSARTQARQALADLRSVDAGVRYGITDEDGNTYNGNGEFWHEVIVASCGIKGGSAHVRKGKMAVIKGAGKALKG